MSEHVLETIDAALADWEIGSDAMRWAPDLEQQHRPVVLRPTFAMPRIVVDTEGIQAAMRGVARAVADVLPKLEAAMWQMRAVRKPVRRNGPPPLCIDGHAYSRRRKARKGKR